MRGQKIPSRIDVRRTEEVHPKKRWKEEGTTHPDALQHVDDVVDPAPLHSEAPGRVVQPDALHAVPVVHGHKARRKAGAPRIR